MSGPWRQTKEGKFKWEIQMKHMNNYLSRLERLEAEEKDYYPYLLFVRRTFVS
jgi:hypothetical protein